MSQYPQIAAGDELTSELLMSMIPQTAYKVSGTIRQSTTTLADDPDLTMTLEANAVYFVEFFIQYSSNATSIKTAWTVPSGASGIRGFIGLGSSATAADNISARIDAASFTSAATFGDKTSVSSVCYLTETSVVTTSSGGTLAYQWAQLASTAEDTQVRAGSFMRVTRIA